MVIEILNPKTEKITTAQQLKIDAKAKSIERALKLIKIKNKICCLSVVYVFLNSAKIVLKHLNRNEIVKS